MIIATDPTHPPHDFLTEGGKLVGWENELMREVAKEMGREVKYEHASFDALIPGLSSGRYDVVFANMGITPERLEVLDMVSAFKSGQAFLAQEGSGLELSSLDTLCGVSVGTTRGSTQEQLATEQSKKCKDAGKPPVEIKLYEAGGDIILAVESGRVDTYWTAGPIAQYYANQPASKLEVAGEVPGTKNLTAIALPKDSGLTDDVHEAVQSLIDDGTYLEILKEWNLESGTISESVVNPEPN